LNLPNGAQPVPFICALVYVPEGMTPQPLDFSNDPDATASLYEPNQHVIWSGELASEFPVTTRLLVNRTLQSGDRIYLLLRNLIPPQEQLVVAFSVALAFQISY
jgi:hypothetical protein